MLALLILLVVATTSLVGYALARRRPPPLAARALAAALGRMLETLGLTLLFLAGNVVLAIVAILGARTLTGEFLSAYAVNDVTLVIVSLIQGTVARWWHRESQGARPTRPSRRDREGTRIASG